ncbi:recombinase family protein [uncultured Eudoraea sp.]|uniref:recombinase family protein n=1 Tax=uncultured Eudoraea sp. TaxID=1035614 RepID=UPI002601FE63|nr:recombinase family protein [uncultured Eudoraea sp.]
MLAIYCRISVDRENQKSIKEQELLGIEFATANNLNYNIYIDKGISGGGDISKRPAFERMINEIQDGKITAVYVWNQDRTEREEITWFTLANLIVENNIELYENGKLIDLNDPTVYFMRGMMSQMNALYRRTTSKKIKAVLKRNAAEGKRAGTYPYGYTKDENGIMVIDDEEAVIIKRIYALSLEGKGTRKIAEILNDDNIPTRYNKIASKGGKDSNLVHHPVNKTKTIRDRKNIKWSDKTVRGIIQNTVYKGERKYMGELYDVPNIFEPSYWQKVNDHLKENRNTQHGNAKKYDYLLRGILRCGRCGRNYHGRVAKRDNFYQCSSKRTKHEKCGNRAINRPFIERIVWNDLFADGEFRKLFIKYIEKQSDKSELDSLKAKRKEFQKESSKLDKRLNRAIELRMDDEITETELAVQRSKIDSEKKRLKSKIYDIDEKLSINNNLDTIKIETEADLDKAIDTTKFNEKKAFIDKYISSIMVVYEDGFYCLPINFVLKGMQPQIKFISKNYKERYSILLDASELPGGKENNHIMPTLIQDGDIHLSLIDASEGDHSEYFFKKKQKKTI